MPFADLIPEEFFIAPPVPPDERNGRVSLLPYGNFKGQILVAWGQGCPVFNANLAAARRLKTAGFGTYRPNDGGWVFHPSAVEQVLAEFEGLVIAEEVRQLLAEPPPPPRPLHGTIRLDAGQYLVCFGGDYNCSRSQFADYLNHAKGIRYGVGGRGWDAASKGWRLVRAAAGRIVHYFPADHFDHPAELLADAKAHPWSPADAAVKATAEAEKAGPDALAVRLTAALETILA